MIIALIIYLVGVVVCWFLMAIFNSYNETQPLFGPIILTSWLCIISMGILIILLYSSKIKTPKFLFNPSLKYFKKKK